MVRLWPFGGDDQSAAGFEKILSNLSAKISSASAKDNRLRTQQRRYRALWTLYSGFAYLLSLLILVLVVGRNNWNMTEYTALAGTPPLIYLVRLVIDTFYNYRIVGTQAYLDGLQKQRGEAIDKLKAATKYNSTQQLLDKYGGTPKPAKTPAKEKKPSTQKPAQSRTGLAPPPTANVNRAPAVPGQARVVGQPLASGHPHQEQPLQPTEEFAPNAFTYQSGPPPPATSATHAYDTGSTGPKWYDRMMDLILGEDETQAPNRIVLICAQCRLVNGQAPPGTRSLDALGKWRCMGCSAMNGTAAATERAIKEVLGSPMRSDIDSEPTSPVAREKAQGTRDKDDEVSDIEDAGVSSDGGPATPVKTTAREPKGQAKQRKK